MTDGREPRAVVQRIWKDIVHPTRIIWANTELVYPADVVYYAHFYKMPNFPMGAGIGGGLLHIGPAVRRVQMCWMAALSLLHLSCASSLHTHHSPCCRCDAAACARRDGAGRAASRFTCAQQSRVHRTDRRPHSLCRQRAGCVGGCKERVGAAL